VDVNGQRREPFLGKLQWLVAECDHRGLVVDVTLTRSAERLADLASHQRAVEVIVQALKPHRNWYLDLANERDARDDRYVSAAELKRLRELVRRFDPERLVTASFGGHDLSEADVRESLLTIGLDFLSPHRPRNAASPSQTEERTRGCLTLIKKLGRIAPVHFQEPFRRGYGSYWVEERDRLGFLENNRWYCIEQYVKLNTPGRSDGVLRGWVDGQLAFEKTDLRFRAVDRLKIEAVWINVYLGGTCAAEQDHHLSLDEIVISKQPIGPLDSEK
jgi:hypothetical protein